MQNENADVYAFDIKIENGGYQFNVQLPGKAINGFELKMGGMHNVENSIAAITVAHHLKN